VGRKKQEIYYDQNTFEGTPEKVFERISKTGEAGGNNSQYSRLAKILNENIEEATAGSFRLEPEVQQPPSTNKYSKNSTDV